MASKVLDPQRLLREIGAAPHGFVFAIPNSNTLAVHRLRSSTAVLAISDMIRIAVQMVAEGPRITHELFYRHDNGIQQITRTDRTVGKVTVVVDGPFQQALGSLPDHT